MPTADELITQHPVAGSFAQVGYVGPGGLEDPQAQRPEHGHEREVARAPRVAGCSE